MGAAERDPEHEPGHADRLDGRCSTTSIRRATRPPPIMNQLVNFGWEYVYHCHILTHEEMDMMRPVSAAVPPVAPDRRCALRQWHNGDVSPGTITRSTRPRTWCSGRPTTARPGLTSVRALSPLDQPNTTAVRSLRRRDGRPYTDYQYRIVAQNTVGYGDGFPSMTVSRVGRVTVREPASRTDQPDRSIPGCWAAGGLTWTDNATNETGFIVERAARRQRQLHTGRHWPRSNTTSFVDTTRCPRRHLRLPGGCRECGRPLGLLEHCHRLRGTRRPHRPT